MLLVYVRLVRLLITARLRAFGWGPWLALVAWAVVAAAQEPAFLRLYGIHLTPQAVWVGAMVLLAAIITPEQIRIRSSRVAFALSSICLVVLLALVHAALRFGVEALFGYAPRPWDVGASVPAFAIAALPFAFALPTGCDAGRYVVVRALVVSIAVGWSIGASYWLWNAGGLLQALGGAVLCSLGSLLATSPAARD